MSFKRIVKNYEKVYRLGTQIIEHKNLVRHAKPEKLDEEFRKQENRIQEFVKLTKEADETWKNNEYYINHYWTGHS